jgi:hypothetical protein
VSSPLITSNPFGQRLLGEQLAQPAALSHLERWLLLLAGGARQRHEPDKSLNLNKKDKESTKESTILSGGFFFLQAARGFRGKPECTKDGRIVSKCVIRLQDISARITFNRKIY